MSKTGKFNVTVQLGKVAYPAGKAVPIGGKGLSEDEALKLEENFGVWTPGEGNGDVDDVVSSLKSDLQSAARDVSRIPGLEADVVRLEGLLANRPSADELADEKRKVEQLEEDNATLAGEVKNLTDGGAIKDARIKVLEDEIEDLKKKVPVK